MKVLIVEDDPDVVEAVTLTFQLRWPGSEVVAVANGEKGVQLAADEAPEVVILDVGLPGINGFEVCRQVREFSDVPILILTASGGDLDKVRGLELGADDYITKPFSPMELLARVRAVLRRSQPQGPGANSEAPFLSGDFSMDFGAREVYSGGHRVRLTPTEYNLLYHLVRNAGRVLDHRTLLQRVWGPEYIGETDYLKVHVNHLRQKLGDDSQEPRLIVTERGVGYKFVRAPG